MIIAVSGWRNWDSKRSVATIIGNIIDNGWGEIHQGYPNSLPLFRFGDNPDGLDDTMWELCAEWQLPHERYVADWEQHGKAAGPLRNRAMLRGTGYSGERAQLLLAFPEPGKYPKLPGSGTWGCIGEAATLGIQTSIYPSTKLTIDTGFGLGVFSG